MALSSIPTSTPIPNPTLVTTQPLSLYVKEDRLEVLKENLEKRWVSNHLWSLWQENKPVDQSLSRADLNQLYSKFKEENTARANEEYQKHAQKELDAYLDANPFPLLGDYASQFSNSLRDPSVICSFHKGFMHQDAIAPLFSNELSQNNPNPSFMNFDEIQEQLKGSEKSLSAGLLLTFPDGRIVLVEPSRHFAGYSRTFPKGRVEQDASIIETAKKEAIEESGFEVRLDGRWHGVYQGGSTWVFLFSATVVGGDPSNTDFETDHVHLVPQEQVLNFLKENAGAWPYRAYQDFLNSQNHPLSTQEIEIGGEKKCILSKESVEQELKASWKMLEKIDSESKEKQLASVGWSPENQDLNRHKDCVPFDHNRIILSSGRYISASLISNVSTQSFIASQGPTENTKGDFWRMFFEKADSGQGLVVMVTNTVEKGIVKCPQYWPNEDQTLEFEEEKLSVEAMGEKEIYRSPNGRPIVLRKFTVTLNGEKRQIDQLQFLNWPDKGCIDPSELKELVLAMVPYQGKDPITVHCSRGIGRSSAVILASTIFESGKKQAENKDFIDLDIFTLVSKLKKERRYLIPAQDQGELAIETGYQLLASDNK